MKRRANSDTIPIDLIPDILSRLPAKSIARFRFVSKLWYSLLHKPYFTELFLTRSLARPRLLIGVKQYCNWFFFSSPQPQNLLEKSSLVVSADFHTKISLDTTYSRTCSYASGLLYFPSIRISNEDKDDMKVICNPSTGQYAILPEPRTTYRTRDGFLGFDPIGKQFKVLAMNNGVNGRLSLHILTLGTETLRWRTIQCPSIRYLDPLGNRICINGVLYYIACLENLVDLLGCFDVRSENFKLIDLDPECHQDASTKLINYKGKLGVINSAIRSDGGFLLKLQMWVLEDVEKPEWSTYVYTLRNEEYKVVRENDRISVVGATALGEIVLAKENACKRFYVLYFNPERNTLLSVEIQGVGKEEGEWSDYHQVYAFVDHVEDLNFDVMNSIYAATPISRPEQSKSSKEDHQVSTVVSHHQQQDRHQIFDDFYLLEDY